MKGHPLPHLVGWWRRADSSLRKGQSRGTLRQIYFRWIQVYCSYL